MGTAGGWGRKKPVGDDDDGEENRRRWEGYKVWWNVDGAVSTNGALGVVDEFGERRLERRKRRKRDGVGERANARGARDGVFDG